MYIVKICAMAVFVATALVGCKHSPSLKDKKRAESIYAVALTYVHEAQRNGVSGQLDAQDLKYRQAIKELLAASELDPENPDVHYLLAVVYFTGFKKHAEAEKHLRTAIDLRDGNYPEADHLLGTVLVDAGRPKDAIPFLQRARTNLLYATPYFAEQELGWAKHKLGQHKEAALHFEKALLAQPDLCGTYTRLADVYEADNNHAAALKVLEKFLAHCDSDRLRDKTGDQLLAYGYYRYGMNLAKAGQPKKAKESLAICAERFKAQYVSFECHQAKNLIR